jgi:diketogulonate reductase-like aldo/keto reductase
VREFCAANVLIYQAFSQLTANWEVMACTELARIAERYGRTVCQIVFRFALDVGMVPLTGTTDAAHMKTALEVFDLGLEPGEVDWIEGLAAS